MNILITGIQGSGKGTQAKKIAEMFGIQHISFGDTIKQCFKDDPNLVLPYSEEKYNRGELAIDQVLFNVANKFLPELEKKGGFILDGFPRTEGQMKFVLDNYKIDVCLKLIISKETAIERMLARKRSDDTIEGIERRLNQYFNITEPVFNVLKDKTIEICGSLPENDVFTIISKELIKYA